jgi:hypothetical protein
MEDKESLSISQCSDDFYYSLDSFTIEPEYSDEEEIEELGRMGCGYTRCSNWKCKNSVSRLPCNDTVCAMCGSSLRSVSKTLNFQDVLQENWNFFK